jgi:transporter family protein
MDSSTIIFLALAIVAWGMGAFFDKMTLRYVDPSSAFYLRMLFMLVLFIPFLLWKYLPTRTALLCSNKLASLFIFLSVIVTMGGVFFYLRAMSGGEASKVVPLSSTYPVVTFLLVYLFLGESFTVTKFIGTLLISGGIYFISK